MGQTDKLPDSEDFTKEVESVIDDLFTPSKAIEIDPLTNEIKDVDESTDQSLSDLSLEMEDATEEAGPEPQIELEEDGAPKAQAEEPSEVLEFDLKLEIEPEPLPEENASDQGAGGEAPEFDSDSLLNEIQQAVWTLEWEVTEDSIRELRQMLGRLKGEIQIPDQGFSQVVKEMEQVLGDMEQNAENVPTSAPVALKKGVEYLMACKGEQTYQGDLQELFNEAISGLNAAFASHKAGEQKNQGDDLGEQMESLDLEIEPEPEPPVSQPEPPAPQVEQEIHKAVDSGQQRQGPPSLTVETAESSRMLAEHLSVLQTCVERIRPVEQLLANTRGMNKLHMFLEDLRKRLERQIGLLQELVGGDIPAAPAPETTHESHFKAATEQEKTTDQEPPREPSKEKCPWKELFLARIGDITAGLIMEEVAFHGTVPLLAGGNLMNQKKIALKRLKPWPWSKLSSLVQGNLLAIEESELTSMEVPVMQFTNPTANPDKGRNVVILSQDSKTAVVFLDTEPDYFSVDEDHTYEPASPESPWEGVLKVDGKTIHIMSVNRVS